MQPRPRMGSDHRVSERRETSRTAGMSSDGLSARMWTFWKLNIRSSGDGKQFLITRDLITRTASMIKAQQGCKYSRHLLTGKLIMQRTNSNISKGQNKRMKLEIYASPIINKTENNVKKDTFYFLSTITKKVILDLNAYLSKLRKNKISTNS